MHLELLEKLLKYYHIPFNILNTKFEHIPSEIKNAYYSELAIILLISDEAYVVAVYPAAIRFTLAQQNETSSKSLRAMLPDEAYFFSSQLLSNSLPELMLEKAVHVMIDKSILSHKRVYFRGRDKKILILNTDALYKLSSDIQHSGITSENKIITTKEIHTPMNFKERVKAMHSLPPMPETASAILKLRAMPDIKVEQIVPIIEKDPLLAAQIVSYANSAFFGQAGSVKSIKDAIFRVLGVDTVLNMALALSIGTTFKIPQHGPVGSRKIWQSSIYVAALMQRLTMLMPWGQRLNPGTAYLVGLLHDVGLLVLGHLFPDEYQKLNQFLQDEPEAKILEAENSIFGVTHTEIGKIVMRLWNMPEELITVTTYHHNNHFQGEYEEYVQLLVIVESLLSQHGLARDDYAEEIPMHFLEKLHIEEEDVIIAADEVLQEGEIIEALARQMCA